MSVMLHIYNRMEFREVRLPGKATRYFVVSVPFLRGMGLRFHLTRHFGGWRLRVERGKLLLNGQTALSLDLHDGLSFEAQAWTDGAASEEECRASVFVLEKPDFLIYQKYRLADLTEFHVSSDTQSELCAPERLLEGASCSFSLRTEGDTVLTAPLRDGVYVNGRSVSGEVPLKFGDFIQVMHVQLICLGSLLAVENREEFSVSVPREETDDLKRLSGSRRAGGENVPFHRSPRIMEEFQMYAEREENLSLKTEVLPLALHYASMTLSLTILSIFSGVILLGGFTPLAMFPSTAFFLFTLWQSLSFRAAEKRRLASCRDRMQQARKRFDDVGCHNADILRVRYPDAEACCAMDADDARLWNRNEWHKDFLCVRLGLGDIPAPEESIPKIDAPFANPADYILRDVPVTLNLEERRVVGIVGPEEKCSAIAVARSMIVQIAAANAYTDVKIVIICNRDDPDDRSAWNFAMWLPHVWSPDRKTRYMASTPEERESLLKELGYILEKRELIEDPFDEALPEKPRFVLFVSDAALLEKEDFSRYIFHSKRTLGLSTVFLAESAKELPNLCEDLIILEAPFSGVCRTNGEAHSRTTVRFDEVSEARTRRFARTLGRLELPEVLLTGDIPESLMFFDMLRVKEPRELRVEERWRDADTTMGLKTVLGWRSGNLPCWLYIGENDHGIVVGTPGVGLTELLQTLLLSLAVNYSPEDVNFFLIGTPDNYLAKSLDGLPHLIGTAPSSSETQIQRIILSIQNEIKRREKLFQEYDIRRINTYTVMYKQGNAAAPISHLFIVVSDFDEWRRNDWSLFRNLTDTIYSGQHLGIHMLLVTERPSESLNDSIREYSNFRLCMRVRDEEDSKATLNSPDAVNFSYGQCRLQSNSDKSDVFFRVGWCGGAYGERGYNERDAAQILNLSGKVELAVNHSRIRFREQRRHTWVKEIIEILRATEAETDISVSQADLNASLWSEFWEPFYSRLRMTAPKFNASPDNTLRMRYLFRLYQEFSETEDADQAASFILARSSLEQKRLPELPMTTELDVTVKFLKNLAWELNIEKSPALWTQLPNLLFLDAIEDFRKAAFDGAQWVNHPGEESRPALRALTGIIDNPFSPFFLDFIQNGHHRLIGRISSGKSTFLQTVVYSLASCYPPELLNVYCLDFSSQLLSVFEGLPHLGAYMTEADISQEGLPFQSDTVTRFFTLIIRILTERKARYREMSFAEFFKADDRREPLILIVIDGYAAFWRMAEERHGYAISALLQEGARYGIYFLVSANDDNEIPSRFSRYFHTAVSLELTDKYDYKSLLGTSADIPDIPHIPGRGVTLYEGRAVLFQTALAASSESVSARNAALAERIEQMREATEVRAEIVPEIPPFLTNECFQSMPGYLRAMENPELLPIGLDMRSGDVYSFSLLKHHIFLITGTRQSGKSEFLVNLLRVCAARGDRTLVFTKNSFSSVFQSADALGSETYTSDTAYQLLASLYPEVIERVAVKKAYLGRRNQERELFYAALEHRRIDVLIEDSYAFFEALCNENSPASNGREFLEALWAKGEGYNIFFFCEIPFERQADLKFNPSFQSMRENNAVLEKMNAIHFGGRFNEQKIVEFNNMGFKTSSRDVGKGIGVIAERNPSAPLVTVVLPYG